MTDVEGDRDRRGEQARDEVGGVEAALLRGAEHRGQDLLGLSPARGAMTTAAGLARDHGGA